jgi:TolB-like protein/Flp pilus assembly protein TadD
MNRLKRIIREVHRRSVWQVLGIYVFGSWIALQVVETLSETVGLPEWFPPFAVALLIIGLPIVVATAFVQEGIPQPARPHQVEDALPATPREGKASPAHGLLTWRFAIGGGVLAFALWGVVAAGWLIFGRGDRAAQGGPTDQPASVVAIAVLPFETLSPDQDDQYFADGIHEEIISRLAGLEGLRVISRTSVLTYRGSGKDVPTIADELGVGFILAGTVRRQQERVRVSAALIEGESDNLIWSEVFEREWEDLFAIQDEVGRRVAGSLDVRLTPEQQVGIGTGATEDLVAYDHYLRGRDLETRSRQEPDFLASLAAYGRAVEVDPGFALAHVRMATVHSRVYWFGFDRSSERVAMARRALDRAFELAPGLPEAHLASAWHFYQVERDYEAALAELELASPGLGERAEYYLLRAAIARRQGRMEDAITDFGRSLELNPRSAELAMDIANTYVALQRHEDAEQYFRRSLDINPRGPSPYWWKAWHHILWTGDLDGARRLLSQADSVAERDAWRTRDWDWARLELLARDPQAALDRMGAADGDWIQFQYGEVPRSLMVGEAYVQMGDTVRSRAHFEEARGLLVQDRAARPDDGWILRDLSLAEARLGNGSEAVRLARRAMEVLPAARDALLAPDFRRNLATVYVIVGRHEDAIEELRRLLEAPGRALSLPLLRIDPTWDPLRGDPRFSELLVA